MDTINYYLLLERNAHYIVTSEREEVSRKQNQNLWDVLSSLTGAVEGPGDWVPGA
jgi:hypothetical protein